MSEDKEQRAFDEVWSRFDRGESIDREEERIAQDIVKSIKAVSELALKEELTTYYKNHYKTIILRRVATFAIAASVLVAFGLFLYRPETPREWRMNQSPVYGDSAVFKDTTINSTLPVDKRDTTAIND